MSNIHIPEADILRDVRERLFISDPHISPKVAAWLEEYLIYVSEVPTFFAYNYPSPGPRHWSIPTLRVIGTTAESNSGNMLVTFSVGRVFTTAEAVLFDVVSGHITSKFYDHRLARWCYEDHGVLPISDYLVGTWGSEDKLEMLASLLLINPSSFNKVIAMVEEYGRNYLDYISKGEAPHYWSGLYARTSLYKDTEVNRRKVTPPPVFPSFIDSIPSTQLALF